MNFNLLLFVFVFVESVRSNGETSSASALIVIMIDTVPDDFIAQGSRLSKKSFLTGGINPAYDGADKQISLLLATGPYDQELQNKKPIWIQNQEKLGKSCCINWPHSQRSFDGRKCPEKTAGNFLMNIKAADHEIQKNSVNLVMIYYENKNVRQKKSSSHRNKFNSILIHSQAGDFVATQMMSIKRITK